MLVIVDYGVGNLFSLKSSLIKIGEQAVVSGEKSVIESATKIILPGVGAFGDASKKLSETGLDKVIKDMAKKGVPVMGICLGMQLLFDKSYEYGEHSGLGLIKGEIRPISEVIPTNYKVPHIGWNALCFKKESALNKFISNGDHVYFVHSYYATNCDESVVATAEYGAMLTATVESGNVYGCQFHPEKSGDVGLNILKAFCSL